MAEIPIEKKSGKGWLWLLLILLAVIALAWWLLDNDGDAVEYTDEETVAAAGTEPAGRDTGALPGPVATGGAVTIAAILGNPTGFIGEEFRGEVTVPDVPTDRGFWVEDQGQRLFAVIVDQPSEVPLDINPGEQLRITEGVLHNQASLGDLIGDIDPDTRAIIEDQEVFLVVDEDDIEILP